MKQLILYPFFTLLIVVAWNSSTSGRKTDTWISPGKMIAADTSHFEQDKALAELHKKIEGREEAPSSEVYKDIQIFKQIPAGRLLRIMEMGFSRSLGVNCTHCHNPENWAGDEKPQKQIAREMMQMVGKINGELLAKIENLDSENPAINCTTCHRGEVKPALNLDK